jgi:hypothetical protein
MISRRDVVTAGVLGTLTGTALDAGASPAVQDDPELRKVLIQMNSQLVAINGKLHAGLLGPEVVHGGFLADIRNKYSVHLRSTGKFPDFLEIGTDVFYDVYDWHVRHNQPIQITRISEQRFAIQWMFTQLVVRFETDSKFIGVPFDRG